VLLNGESVRRALLTQRREDKKKEEKKAGREIWVGDETGIIVRL